MAKKHEEAVYVDTDMEPSKIAEALLPMEKSDGGELAKVAAKEAESFFATPDDAREMLARGAVLAERHLSMTEENQSVKGYFLGFSSMETTDESTGEVRQLPTVILENANHNARARLIGNHELRTKLANVEKGTFVLIVRGKLRSLGKGRTVAEYDVLIDPPNTKATLHIPRAELPAAPAA